MGIIHDKRVLIALLIVAVEVEVSNGWEITTVTGYSLKHTKLNITILITGYYIFSNFAEHFTKL